MPVNRKVDRKVDRKAACAGLVLGLALAAPLPALAQGGPGVLPPYEIVTILRSTGMTPLGQPMRRGPTYVLRAVDEDGEEVRVVVDARHGEIVSVTPTESASLMPPPRGTYRRPQPAPPPGVVYVDPDPLPPGAWRAEPPEIYGERPVYPPEAMPERYSSAPSDAPREPRVIPAPGPGDTTGGLPPPPDRFERRVAPSPGATRSAQPRRTASSSRVTGQPPIPRPRPAGEPAAATPQAPPAADAAPLPPPVPDERPDADSVPH